MISQCKMTYRLTTSRPLLCCHCVLQQQTRSGDTSSERESRERGRLVSLAGI